MKDTVPAMQRSALVEGATLRHLHAALFTKTNTQRQILMKDLRFHYFLCYNLMHISCHLIGLWTSGNPDAEEFLSRIFPPALLCYLNSDEQPPPEEDKAPFTATGSF